MYHRGVLYVDGFSHFKPLKFYSAFKDDARLMVVTINHDVFVRLIEEDAAEALDDIIANRAEELRLIGPRNSTTECFLGERALTAFTQFFNPRNSGHLSLILWFLFGLGIGLIVHHAKLLSIFLIVCLILFVILISFPQ